MKHTPSELIDLQHDTWAYELKVWAEERQAKPVSRKPRYWAVITLCVIVVMLLSCSKSSPIQPCYKCQSISQGRTYNEQVCGNDPYKKLPEEDNGGRLAWNCEKIP